MRQTKAAHSSRCYGKVTITATKAKNAFGSALEQAMRGTPVFITKSRHPKAVLLSIEDYESLSGLPQFSLLSLSQEFDEMFARMQKPGMRRAMESAFRTPTQELGRIAQKAARKRG